MTDQEIRARAVRRVLYVLVLAAMWYCGYSWRPVIDEFLADPPMMTMKISAPNPEMSFCATGAEGSALVFFRPRDDGECHAEDASP